MADNTTTNPGTGGDTFGSDDITGVKYPRVKLIHGADGTNDGDVATANPLPVVQTGTPGLPTGAATAAKQDTGNTSIASIDGKITAVDTGAVVVSSSALPTGASTSAKQDTGNTSLASIDGKITAVNTGAVVVASGSITADTELTTADVDTGAGTDTRAVVGLVGTKSGGGVLIPGDATAGLKVDLGSDNDVTVTNGTAANLKAEVTGATAGSGTATGAIRVELPTNGTGVIATVGAVTALTGGGVADDATTPGNPIMIGGVAVETDGTDPTAVSAEDDVARLRTDRNRILLVNPTPPRHWSVSADYASAQTNTSVKASPGASLKLYITDISISNGATAGNITLLDGSGGTVLYEIYPAINGGAVDNRRTPIVLTAATALCITSTTVTTHSVNISGYIAP